MESPNDWDSKVFQSSNLLRGRYSPSARKMVLEFGNGAEYDFAAPPELWDKLKSSQRPGKFYHEIVKPNFPVISKRKEKEK